MATIGNSYHGLIDHFKSVDRNGKELPVIEALSAINPIMYDAYVQEANNGFGHTSVIRTGLPASTWGKLYQGIPASKATKAQVNDTSGFLEGLAEIDTRLLNYKSNPKQARADEAAAQMESISQNMQTAFFYSDPEANPEQPKGLAARYDTIANGHVVDAGGTGSDNTSIWVVTWGKGSTSLFYPENSKAGIVREDKGEYPAYDDLNNKYFVKGEYFRQDVGVTVGDWRNNARIANIDVSDVNAGTVDVYKLLRKALYKTNARRTPMLQKNSLSNPLIPASQTVIYMNSTMIEALDQQSVNDNRLHLRPDDLEGKEVLTFRNWKIRETDALINSEARVV